MIGRTTLQSPCFTHSICVYLFIPIAYRTEATLGVAVSDSNINCIEQTTEWSACSRSCGMGLSARVTNRNAECEMVKQTRLCMVRPCEPEHKQPADKVGAWRKPPITERGTRLPGAWALAGHCTLVDSEVSSSWELTPEKRHKSS